MDRPTAQYDTRNFERLRSMSNRASDVLVCTSDARQSREIAVALEGDSLRIQPVASVVFAEDELRNRSFDLCVVDQQTSASLAAVLEDVLRDKQSFAVICLTTAKASAASTDPRQACLAGRVEFVELDEWPRRLSCVVDAALTRSRLAAENSRLKQQVRSRIAWDLVGTSTAIARLREQTQIATESDENVLLVGERGTGKALVARAVHLGSRFASGPLVHVNCRILSAAGLQRELFGVESAGSLVRSAGGTLFLDNVDRIPCAMQNQFISALRAAYQNSSDPSAQSGIRIVGSMETPPSDVGTGVPLLPDFEALLSRVVIEVPTLRDRREDVVPIAERLLKDRCLKEGKPAVSLSDDAIELLTQHDWPGNLVELQNVIEHANSLLAGSSVTAKLLAPWMSPTESSAPADTGGLSLKEMERQLIEATFARCGGNREATARTLKIGLRTLSGKLREYGYPPRGGPGSNLPNSRKKAA